MKAEFLLHHKTGHIKGTSHEQKGYLVGRNSDRWLGYQTKMLMICSLLSGYRWPQLRPANKIGWQIPPLDVYLCHQTKTVIS